MVNHFAVFTKRLIVIAVLATTLTGCTTTQEFPKSRCADPLVEKLDTKWTLYKKLYRIYIHKCSITKITSYHDCHNRNIRNETVTHYDISRRCANLPRADPPSTVTREYPCNRDSEIKRVTEIRRLSSDPCEVSLQTDKIYLPSRQVCKYSLGFCYDNNIEGYAWETNLQNEMTCGNLHSINTESMLAMRLVMDREYVVFEDGTTALAVELAEQLDMCGGKVWTDNKGFFATNDSAFSPEYRPPAVGLEDDMLQKQKVYESLMEDCEVSLAMAPSFVFYATLVLVGYVVLHLIFSVYSHLMNCRTLGSGKGRSCKWMFQGWINREFVIKKETAETKTDIEMASMRRESRPSYYQLRAPYNK